jgi:Ca2+-binding EF-hand superfamily protein
VQLVDEAQFVESKQTFQNIDTDHSGTIDKEKIRRA